MSYNYLSGAHHTTVARTAKKNHKTVHTGTCLSVECIRCVYHGEVLSARFVLHVEFLQRCSGVTMSAGWIDCGGNMCNEP